MSACDKEQYPNKKLAIDALKRIAQRDRQGMYAYYHEECGTWHLSTKGKRKKIQRVKQPTTTNFQVKHSPVRAKPLRETMKRKRIPMPKLISKEMAAYLKRLILGQNAIDQRNQK